MRTTATQHLDQSKRAWPCPSCGKRNNPTCDHKYHAEPTAKTQSVCKHCHANIEWTGHGKVYIDSDLSPFCGNSKVGHEPDPDALVYEPVAEPTSTGEPKDAVSDQYGFGTTPERVVCNWRQDGNPPFNCKLPANHSGDHAAARPSEPSAPPACFCKSEIGDNPACSRHYPVNVAPQTSAEPKWERQEACFECDGDGCPNCEDRRLAVPQSSPKEVAEQSAESSRERLGENNVVDNSDTRVSDIGNRGNSKRDGHISAPQPVAGEGPQCQFCKQPDLYKPATKHEPGKSPFMVAMHESISNPRRYQFCENPVPEGTPKLEETQREAVWQAVFIAACKLDGGTPSTRPLTAAGVKTLADAAFAALRSFIPASTTPNAEAELLGQRIETFYGSEKGDKLFPRHDPRCDVYMQRPCSCGLATPASTGEANGWVSVEERLPDSPRDVLVYADDIEDAYDIAMFDGFDVSKGFDCTFRVTHWRELPPAPGSVPQAEPR